MLPGLLVLAFGIGLCMSPSTMAITESLPAEKQGVASALNDTVRELGGAVGIALLGSLVSAGYRSSVERRHDGLPPDLADRVEEGIGSAFGAAATSVPTPPGCSTPPAMRSSTAGACRCGSAWPSPPAPSCSSSSAAPAPPSRPRRTSST